MGDERWAQVDDYLEELFAPADEALLGVGDRAAAAGLPSIAVSPVTGKLLHVLTLAVGARRVLEIGTLAGYSTIWMARALPDDGRLITLEYSPRHAEVARANIGAAGLADRVEVRVGRALDTLAAMRREEEAPFDLVFVDADKQPYADYLDAAIGLSRPGALIVADNTVREGRVADAADDDPSVVGVRRFHDALAADPRVEGVTVQTVGVKGHDGLSFGVVR